MVGHGGGIVYIPAALDIMNLRSPEVRTYTVRTDGLSFIDHSLGIAAGIVSQIFQRVGTAQDNITILVSTI